MRIMEYISWDRRPAVICAIEAPTHPEGEYVEAYCITSVSPNWEKALPVQFVDILREGEVLSQEEFEEMFGVIGDTLPELPVIINDNPPELPV